MTQHTNSDTRYSVLPSDLNRANTQRGRGHIHTHNRPAVRRESQQLLTHLICDVEELLTPYLNKNTTAFVAGSWAGATATVLTFPLDVIYTRQATGATVSGKNRLTSVMLGLGVLSNGPSESHWNEVWSACDTDAQEGVKCCCPRCADLPCSPLRTRPHVRKTRLLVSSVPVFCFVFCAILLCVSTWESMVRPSRLASCSPTRKRMGAKASSEEAVVCFMFYA